MCCAFLCSCEDPWQLIPIDPSLERTIDARSNTQNSFSHILTKFGEPILELVFDERFVKEDSSMLSDTLSLTVNFIHNSPLVASELLIWIFSDDSSSGDSLLLSKKVSLPDTQVDAPPLEYLIFSRSLKGLDFDFIQPQHLEIYRLPLEDSLRKGYTGNFWIAGADTSAPLTTGSFQGLVNEESKLSFLLKTVDLSYRLMGEFQNERFINPRIEDLQGQMTPFAEDTVQASLFRQENSQILRFTPVDSTQAGLTSLTLEFITN